jgi:hypothetical protein
VARKKKIVTAAALPPAAISLYETLRSNVLRGTARPDGLNAVDYHGMLQGLALHMSARRIRRLVNRRRPLPAIRAASAGRISTLEIRPTWLARMANRREKLSGLRVQRRPATTTTLRGQDWGHMQESGNQILVKTCS